MALETTQKYLDWYGLSLFWNKARQYISNEILALDATKIPVNLTQEPRTTISSEFEKLWTAIGGDATDISGSISQILGAYVKTFKGASGNYINIKVNGIEDITQSTDGPADVELVIDETSLTQKFGEVSQSITDINTKDGEQDGQITSIIQTLSEHTASDHVTQFGTKTGIITIDDAETGSGGTVKFAMNGNTLTANVRGLGNAAYMDPAPYTTTQIESIFVTES